MKKSFRYISHGRDGTGGHMHELFLYDSLRKQLPKLEFEKIRFTKNYQGIWNWIILFFQTFFVANASVNLVVARLFLPAYLRNLFTKNKIILVVHNHDLKDGKPKLYFSLLNWALRKVKSNSNLYCLITVSEYWRDYFYTTHGIKSLVFHNYFKTNKYIELSVKKVSLSNTIHLGMYSEKINRNLYLNFIGKAKSLGFESYFSSPVKIVSSEFPVQYFESTDKYLEAVCNSRATVILNQVNEAWSRVAHESFLLGTQVFTINTGGLAFLVNHANGYVCTDIDEILELIQREKYKEINTHFLYKLDVQFSNTKEIELFINGD